MATYFRLASDCLLVEGARDAALYDATRGRLFLLDTAAQGILQKCEANRPLDCDWIGGDGLAFLQFLRDEGLGFFDDSPAFVERFAPHSPLKFRGVAQKPPDYATVDWAITELCDVGCSFCPYEPDSTSWQACTTCLRKAGTVERPRSFSYTASIVGQIVALGVRRLHIRGGNPLLSWDRLSAVIQEASRYPQLTLVVTTPGSGRSTDDIVAMCSRYHVRLNVVLMATDAETAKQTCGEEIVALQFSLLHELARNSLAFSVTLLLSAATCPHRERMARFVQESWQRKPKVSEICVPQEGGALPFSHLGQRGKHLYSWRTLHNFHARVVSSACLHGRFQIQSDASIHPCAGLAENCGQIIDGDLRAALKQSALYDWWHFNKNEISPCKCCALRYACLNCTAAEAKCIEQESNVRRFCSFDPDGDLRAHQVPWVHSGFLKRAIVGSTPQKAKSPIAAPGAGKSQEASELSSG